MNIIRWNEPKFDSEDISEVTKVLQNNYVNEGPKTKELEEKIKSYLAVKHIIMAANGTAALFLAIKADSIIKDLNNFEVIVPDITMIATATAVGWAGGKVVLADVDEGTHTLEIESVRKKITSKTSAIIPVHILGRSSDLNSLKKIADENNLTIIEDAAGALGSKNDAGYLGTLGKVGCFSLQSNKIITSGQGGFVATNDDKYYDVMRRIRDFGRASNKEFIHTMEGYNLKFSDLAAALAFAQFNKIESRKNMLIQQRKQYESELKDVKQISFPNFNYEIGEVPIWVDAIVQNRKELVEYLLSREIHTRECWPALHRNPPYKHLGEDKDYPISSFAADNVLWLPNGPAISKEDISQVCTTIKEFYRR